MSGNYVECESEPSTVANAVMAFRRGEPVLVHDASDREGETDLVYPAGSVTPDSVARLRNDAGGLICVALGADVADAFDLPYLHDVLAHPSNTQDDIEYDDHPSFSITVNHRDTFTGISDEDRARTITALADAASDPSATDFAEEFRTPGHVHLLRAAPNLTARQGHTELVLALTDEAGLPPAGVVCEMLDDESGGALSPAAAHEYAMESDLVYAEGRDILNYFGLRRGR